MQGPPCRRMSQYQTTGERIIRWILLNYFAIGQSVFNIVHAYPPLKNTLEYMACPTQRPFFVLLHNILNGHSISITYFWRFVKQAALSVSPFLFLHIAT
jgi:hypothetical protein